LNAVTNGNLIFSFECALGAEVVSMYCYKMANNHFSVDQYRG
jgi:hypothetical protein